MEARVQLTNVRIFCPYIGHDIEFDQPGLGVGAISFHSTSQECDICASPGNTMLRIRSCRCGRDHSIELASW